MSADGRPPVRDVMEEIGATALGEAPSPDAVEAVLRRWASKLNGADPLRVRTERDALADLEPISARQVDAALRSVSSDGASNELQGSAVEFEDPEPWPEEVDGASLLAELRNTFTRFLALPDGAAIALALWTVHAHAHDVADISPVLALTSPTKRCGKTIALEVLGSLVPRPLPAANITAASLFRAVEKFSPTLLIDEADTFLKRGDDLRGVLNSGHSRRSAFIVRTVGDDHEPRRFRTWAPKSVALIGELPDTLADRSIEIRMRRRRPDEKVERLRRDRLDQLEPLRRTAWAWAQEHEEEIRAADPNLPAELGDRARDNWRPLLSVAVVAGGDWPARVRRAALDLTESGRERSAGVQLLEDLRDLFEERGVDRLASRNICSELSEMEERPWPEWRAGKAITPRQLAELLRPFEVEPEQMRIAGSVRRGYRLEDLEDPLSRYVGGSTRYTRYNAGEDRGDERSYTRYASGGRNTSESSEEPESTRDVTDVTGRGRGFGALESEDRCEPTPGTCRVCGRSIGPAATICGSCRREAGEVNSS